MTTPQSRTNDALNTRSVLSAQNLVFSRMYIGGSQVVQCEDYNSSPGEKQFARPRDTFITPPSIIAPPVKGIHSTYRRGGLFWGPNALRMLLPHMQAWILNLKSPERLNLFVLLSQME